MATLVFLIPEAPGWLVRKVYRTTQNQDHQDHHDHRDHQDHHDHLVDFCHFLVLRVFTGRRTRHWAGWEGRRKNLPPRFSRGCRQYIFYSTIQQVEIELKARIDKVSAEPEIEDSACCVTLRKRVISIFTRCRGHNVHLHCCYLVPLWRCCRRPWLATVTNSRNFRKYHLVQLSSSRWKFCSILSSHPQSQNPCIANCFVRN